MQRCRLFLMLAFFVGLYSVNGNTSKQGCRGDSIIICENISLNTSANVAIYKNGDNNNIIGMWQIQTSVTPVIKGQNDRVFLDKNGNIWIVNLQRSDETKFTIQFDIENTTKKHEVTLTVMVPPTEKCKPRIVHSENSLSAHLTANECGIPVASVYWLENAGISIAPEVISLRPGKHNGIYHACIKGEALTCAKISNISDYCSVYNVSESETFIDQYVAGGNTPSKSPGPSTIEISICIMVAICLLVLIILSAFKFITHYQLRRERNGSQQKNTFIKRTGATPLMPVET